MTLLPHLPCVALKRKPSARDTRAPRVLSIVGWFRHLPLTHVPASTTHLSPVSKMGREGIEVEVEPITGEKRKTAWGQHLSQRVNHRMGHVLGAGTQLEDGQNLGARVDRHPQPEHV